MRRLLPDGRVAAAAMLVAGCVPAGGSRCPAPPGERATGARTGQAASRARGVERWQCGDRIDGCVFRCPATLIADRLLGIGTITVDGAIEEASVFRMDGFDRRWDWCLEADDSYDCAFLNAPDGDARYVKFLHGESTAKPSQFYACRRVRS